MTDGDTDEIVDIRDLRLWSRDSITEFIALYKSQACLWKVKHKDYKNKYVKALAYKKLVEFCRKHGLPEATKDFVTRKIQSLRGSFRKEMRKMKQAQRAGQVYQSNLWYFKHLMFTKDQDMEEGVDGNNQSDDESRSAEESVQEDVEDGDDGDDDNDDEKYELKPNENIGFNAPETLKKRRREETNQTEFYDIGQDGATCKDFTEFELTGMGIAKKLARMEPTQAIYAESIINIVMRRGLLRSLKEQTGLCDSLCGRH